MEKRILIIGLILVLLFSSIVPIPLGYNIKIFYSKNTSFVSTNYGDPPWEEWNHTLGTEYESEYAESVVQTLDGGYIIVGENYHFDYRTGYNIRLVKTDGLGNELWNATYGGKYNDFGLSIQQTVDKGYIITGFTLSYGAGEEDVFLLKTNESGFEEFNKTFGGFDFDIGWSVQQTSDLGYILGGVTASYGGIWLIKTDSNGNEEWNKTFVGDNDAFAQQTKDGGFIIAGGGYSNICLIKTDSYGNQLWYKTYNGYEPNHIYVQQTKDEGYIIVSDKWVDNKWEDAWLIKTDNNGNVLWDKTYGGSGMERGYSGQETVDGGFIFTGFQRLKSDLGIIDYNILILKTDAEGDEEWNITYNKSYFDQGYSVKQTNDNGYIIAGTAETSFENQDYNIWLIKLAPDYINNPPDEVILAGPNNGKPEKNYTFCIVNARDPEGKDLRVFWDWGDGNNSGWLGLYQSGETICTNHSWAEIGNYKITAYLKDDYGAITNSTMDFYIPRTRASYDFNWLSFLERFPILKEIFS